ncbi:MAG: X-Pro dipeptidyl-peptidase [Planctomycetaceae bacterium]|nr:X-Pro dipeptidyl-peptidase [Planctomycetaceae bacterium]
MLAHRSLPVLLVVALFGICNARVVMAQGLEHVKSHYTKYEYRIPMRDGKRLFTAVYVPKDDSQSYPFLLKRTPYSARPYGADQYPENLGPSALFGKEGYIFVYQDVRGRWMSEGEFVHMRPHRRQKQGKEDIDESSDTWDTVDWLVKNIAGNNGKVGIAGISYPGFYTAAGIIDSHPAIKAASPQAPVNDWFAGDDWHHNGAFFLAHMFNWMSRSGRARPEPTKKYPRETFDYGTPDGYEFYRRIKTLSEIDAKYLKGDVAFWNETLKHGSYDEFWKSRNIRPHLRNIKPAVMTVGGWFDAENLFGALETYKYIEANNPQTSNILVMGPWRHGAWSRDAGDSFGDIPFNSKTAEFYREHIEFPFFQKHLKGEGDEVHPEAWVFETGTNQWRKYDRWPPKQAELKSLYFRAGEQFAIDAQPKGDAQAYDEYISDPNKPVGYMSTIETGMKAEYMIADQRFATQRSDVLVYRSEQLEEDVTIAGPVEVDLFVSTSGTDSDWVVKLIDVYPDDYPDAKENPKEIRMGGYEQLVRGDVMRGKFRNSLERPEPFEPNQPTRVRFTMPDTYHSFRAGHRIMVHVQSSWFPLVDRNPQQFLDIYHAKESDYQRATQRVYRGGDKPSRLRVLVLP